MKDDSTNIYVSPYCSEFFYNYFLSRKGKKIKYWDKIAKINLWNHLNKERLDASSELELT